MSRRLAHARTQVPTPLALRPVKADYFAKRVPYDWTAMLKNPMVIIMGITLLMGWAMPKMMANMGACSPRLLRF